MPVKLSCDSVVVFVRIAQPADAGVAPGTATIRPKTSVSGQIWNPGALVWNSGDVLRTKEAGQISPAAGSESLPIPYPEIVSHNCPARQIEFFVAELVIFVQVIAQQFQFARKSCGARERKAPGHFRQIHSSDH